MIFFGSAAFQALCAEHVDPDVLRSLLLAVNRSAKHIMALGLSMSAVLLHQRRNAALNTSNLLLSRNKDSIRAAPLNSSSLFGGKIEEVFRANLDDRHHSLLRANYSGVSANRKRPSSSTFNSNPAKKSRWEPKASRVPTSTSSSSAVSFKRFPKGAVVDHLLSGGGGGALLGGVNDIIRALPSAPHPSLPVGARLLNFVEAWSVITQDSWALSILWKGYRIPFAREPPLSLSPILFPVAQQHLNHLREEVQILLEKRAVEIVRDTTSPGFYSRIFLVKKKTGRFRLIIDLSSLNKMMKVDHFQMETVASIRRAIPPGAWAVSIDLMDAYLHIPIHPASRKYLRFSLEGTIYQFRALPFGISTAPFVFTNLIEIVAGHIRSLGPNIHQYFDD